MREAEAAAPPAAGASRGGDVALRVAAVGVAAAALVLTWLRLFLGMDLQDESFYVLVPWRWALGDRPFVDEQNLAQMPALIEYPFFKLFAIVRDYDVTGLVLYGRHLYLALMVGVAVAVFLLLRRLVRWELALVACLVFFTYIFWNTPQLSYNTLAAAFLTLGAVAASWTVVLGRGPRCCLLSGAAYGLAAVAYPSLLFVMPFFAIALALAMGDRATGLLATGRLPRPPDEGEQGTGPGARRAVVAWVLGGILVLVPAGVYVLTRGVDNVRRSLDFTFASASQLDQLGGADKAVAVASGYWRFITVQPLFIVAALVVYLVFRRWPRVGRLLLAGVPLVLLFAGRREMMHGAGFVLAYAVLVPYLYLFLPPRPRAVAAQLLVWVWAPAVLAGVMTAYTSAAGYVHGPVGLMPALVPGGLFLAWALEEIAPGRADQGDGRGPDRAGWAWIPLTVLTLVVAVTIGFQFWYQQREVPRSELTTRCDFGPWWGIKLTPDRYDRLRRYATALERESRPGDSLLCFYQGAGYYLFWEGEIAADSYWLSGRDEMGPLPESTYAFYRRHREVPTLVVHLLATDGLSDAELQAGCGGLDYPVVARQPEFAMHRKPASETVRDVLMRLPE